MRSYNSPGKWRRFSLRPSAVQNSGSLSISPFIHPSIRPSIRLSVHPAIHLYFPGSASSSGNLSKASLVGVLFRWKPPSGVAGYPGVARTSPRPMAAIELCSRSLLLTGFTAARRKARLSRHWELFGRARARAPAEPIRKAQRIVLPSN